MSLHPLKMPIKNVHRFSLKTGPRFLSLFRTKGLFLSFILLFLLVFHPFPSYAHVQVSVKKVPETFVEASVDIIKKILEIHKQAFRQMELENMTCEQVKQELEDPKNVLANMAVHSLLTRFLGEERAQYVLTYSKLYGVPPFLVMGVIHVESRNQKYATSRYFARGLMQIMPDTAVYLSNALSLHQLARQLMVNPGIIYEEKLNIQLGTFYLSFLRERYASWADALHAYNMGAGNFERGKRNHRYANPILTIWKEHELLSFNQANRITGQIVRN